MAGSGATRAGGTVTGGRSAGIGGSGMFRTRALHARAGLAVANYRFPVMARVTQPAPVAHRRALVKAGTFHMGQMLDPVMADAIVYKPPVVIAMEIVPDHAMLEKPMHMAVVDMPGPFMAAHAHKPFMEMIVAHEREAAFAQAKVKIQAHRQAVVAEAAIDKHRPRRQRCPADATIHFIMPPENPGRPPDISGCQSQPMPGYMTQRP